MVAVEVFSLLASGAGILSLIFAPQVLCYFVQAKPEHTSSHQR